MLDGEGRLIEYLRLSVTDRCNCRCTYCMPAGGVPMLGHKDILSFEELTEVVGACAQLGVRKVRLTGGEPLVRRGLPELVRMIRAVPGVEELAMTTNATLLAPVAAELHRAGLDRLNVSLDTLDAARYAELTRGGSLEDALAGLAAARDAGFSRTKVNCVLMGGVNDADVPRLAELARTEPIDVRFIELMPMGPCAGWPKARFVPAEDGARGRAGPCAPAPRRRGRALARPRLGGQRGPHPAHEPPLLRRLQPHPRHGGRPAQAVPALRGGDSAARPSRGGASRRAQARHCRKAGIPSHGQGPREPERA